LLRLLLHYWLLLWWQKARARVGGRLLWLLLCCWRRDIRGRHRSSGVWIHRRRLVCRRWSGKCRRGGWGGRLRRSTSSSSSIRVVACRRRLMRWRRRSCIIAIVVVQQVRPRRRLWRSGGSGGRRRWPRLLRRRLQGAAATCVRTQRRRRSGRGSTRWWRWGPLLSTRGAIPRVEEIVRAIPAHRRRRRLVFCVLTAPSCWRPSPSAHDLVGQSKRYAALGLAYCRFRPSPAKCLDKLLCYVRQGNDHRLNHMVWLAESCVAGVNAGRADLKWKDRLIDKFEGHLNLPSTTKSTMIDALRRLGGCGLMLLLTTAPHRSWAFVQQQPIPVRLVTISK
jgi:hypothetical protein